MRAHPLWNPFKLPSMDQIRALRVELGAWSLCLRILQAALVYVNTLMLQDLLAEPDWEHVLTPEDQRGLTPLFWSHVLPYGDVKLNMTSRLPLSTS